MKAEQLKTIGRTAGYDIRLYKNMALSYDDRLGNVEWNPETNAEQTLMVLEWLTKQGLRIKFEWIFGVKYWDVDAYNVDVDIRVQHKDFQTAVCMAVFEIINQTQQR